MITLIWRKILRRSSCLLPPLEQCLFLVKTSFLSDWVARTDLCFYPEFLFARSFSHFYTWGRQGWVGAQSFEFVLGAKIRTIKICNYITFEWTDSLIITTNATSRKRQKRCKEFFYWFESTTYERLVTYPFWR